jgi:Lrp/AsnC family leucine-responsive transcriptional regulator
MQMDSIDLKILSELQQNAKLTNAELASRVNLSASPCLTRVRALEAAGIIDRYVTLLDPEEIGLTVNVFIQISLDRQVEMALERFEKAVSQFPEVMECYLMTGNSDYLLRVVVKDLGELERLIVNRLSRIENMSSIRSSIALKRVKYHTELPLPQPNRRAGGR